MESNDVNSATPAGIKKKARCPKKKSDIVSTFSTLMILVHNKSKSIIIPSIFPGMGKERNFEISSPIR